MHVGHIRSTGIGDALQRTLRLLGHASSATITSATGARSSASCCWAGNRCWTAPRSNATPSPNWNGCTRSSTPSATPNPARLEEAKAELVKLQAGDAENTAIWQEMIALSQKQFDDDLRPAGREIRSSRSAKVFTIRWLGGVVQGFAAARHRARERRRGGRVQRWLAAAEGGPVSGQPRRRMGGRPRAGAQERRRFQLHDHRPGHD